MKLLSESALITSAIVANNRMNRERNASGVNSYEQEFKFRPEALLAQHIRQYGHVRWLDICCGQGKALIQAATQLANDQLQDKAALSGMDLIDGFWPAPDGVNCLSFAVQSAVSWEPIVQYDLITCVHGLHYMGDKLLVLSKIFAAMSENGVFYGNFDVNSVVITGAGKDYLKKVFRQNDIQYNARTKVLHCKGPRAITFGREYAGADDQAGPNYTGQEAVTSYYN